MSVWTLCGFLLGRRNAIQKVAETRSAVWLGLLFVISAGLAREYDGEDLLHEPWHLALPAAASLATSFVLFVLLCLAGGLRRWNISTFASEYRRFLGLYWMTAPLAWLYAIPVERWMSPGAATEANLQLLGLVALWRVLLMIRIVSVVFSTRWHTAFVLVAFFADTVMLTLLHLTPLPVISIMGGVRLSPSEQVISATSFLAGLSGILTWPVWAIVSLVIIWSRGLQPYELHAQSERPSVGLSAWLLGVVALLVWIPILPQTQPEQQLRHVVENELRNGQIERALATMSKHKRSDFPPHWDPPPRVGFGENSPRIVDVMEIVVANDMAAWVRELYQRKFEDFLGNGYRPQMLFYEMDNAEFDRYLDLMEQLPVSPEFLKEHREVMFSETSEYGDRTEEQISRLRKLLGFADDRATSGIQLPTPGTAPPASADSSSDAGTGR
jgi:hypothetical protein